MSDLNELVATLHRMENRLADLEKAHTSQAKTGEELLDMYDNVKGFFKVLAWMERVSIWLAKMTMAGGIVWWLFKESLKQGIADITGGK